MRADAVPGNLKCSPQSRVPPGAGQIEGKEGKNHHRHGLPGTKQHRGFPPVVGSIQQIRELKLKETLLSNADTTNISSIDTDLIVFDPEMEYFPKSFWQVSLVFFTWPYGIIRS